MNYFYKILIWFVVPVVFFLGFVLGLSQKHIPYFKFDLNINVVDLLSLITTIVIAVLIPLWLQKFLRDKRDIKSLIMNEVLELIEILSEIPSMFTDDLRNNGFGQKDRNKVNSIYHQAEIKISFIQSQLKTSFGISSKKLIKQICGGFRDYKHYTTGGELMKKDFFLNDKFKRNHNTEYTKLIRILKNAIHDVHKL